MVCVVWVKCLNQHTMANGRETRTLRNFALSHLVMSLGAWTAIGNALETIEQFPSGTTLQKALR